MFYGREEDLADLMALWRKPTASLVTCRGRRRIGKSTLVEEFARRSKARFVEIAGAAPGWDSIMGLQFENLVVNNMSALLPRLGLDRVLLKSAAPWRQLPTKRRRGCQIDLLLQSEKSAFVIEIKRKNEIGAEIEKEIAAKVKALALPQDVSVRTALVYDGHLSPSVETNGYIDVIILAYDMLE